MSVNISLNHSRSYSLLSRACGGTRWNVTITFGVEKLEWCGCPTVKKFDGMFSRFDTIPACNRQTDRRLATA